MCDERCSVVKMVKVSSTFLFLVGIIILFISVYGLLWNELWLTIAVTVTGMLLLIVSALTNMIGSEVDIVDSQGRAVLITGCDSGFGHEIAIKFNEVGFKVFAGCLQPDGEGAQTLKQQSCGRIFVFGLDVTSDESVNECLTTVKKLLNHHVLWCLINNAGIAEQSLVEFCPLDSFQRHLEVNTVGPIRMTKSFLPLIRRSRGRIINIISMAGRCAPWCLGAYNTSKYALLGFNDSLRREMTQFGVKVISIEPGKFKTPIMSSESAIELNKQYWRKADDDMKAFYGENFYKSMLRLFKKRELVALADLSLVTDEVMDAAVNMSPKSAYYCSNLLGRWMYTIVQLLPYWVQDSMVMSNAPDEKCAANIDDT